jgi:hypothetical protein
MIDYDGRRFRKAGGGDGTIARYHQAGDLVWADFAGGQVRRGTLAGTCGADGTLRLAYAMVLASGEVISGHTVNVPEPDADGRLVLREKWERYGAHPATGISYLEEVGRDLPEWPVGTDLPGAGVGRVVPAPTQQTRGGA